MKSLRALSIRLGVFAVVMGLLLLVVFQAITRPVDGSTSQYTALFTDANGLRTGDDVRLFGVRVGKVGDLRLEHAQARVEFSLATQYAIYGNTELAIRYQNLTGKRYLDIQQDPNPVGRWDAGQTIGTGHTIPAFDITTLFNGLRPVLAELTPDDLNQFATSMLGVIEGQGTGLGPALDAIEKLSRYTTDRQALMSTLVRNLSAIAGQIGGRSGNAMVVLTQLTQIFTVLQDRVAGLIDFANVIPPVLVPLRSLLDTVGLHGDPNADFADLVHRLIPDPAQALDVLRRLPGVLQTLAAQIPHTGSGVTTTCSNGAATAPQPLRVLIDGQRIALCKG